MAEFICKLGTPGGDVVTRTVEGLSEQELRQRLAQEGYRIFSVKTSGMINGVRVRGTGARSIKIKLDDFLLFNQQLAALIHAGLPVLQSIQMLRQRSPNPKLRIALSDVEARITSGSALSEALAAQGETFPKIYTASILAGERSGNLDDVLRRYVEYTKAIAQLRRKIRGALTYPVMLLCSAFILIGILTTFVIPQFSLLYDNLGGDLPAVTTFVVGVSAAVRENVYWLLPALLITGASIYSWRRTENGRRTMDRWVLKVPVVGDLIKQLTTAQFCRSLGTLLRGGLTLVESLQIALQSISNRELLRSTEPALSKIREGKPFTESLTAAGWTPELAIDMIGVGERSGSLREMLDEVAGFYDAETETKLGQLTSLIEPAILLMMAGVVITILLAIYLPLLQMVSKVGA
ncbi:MAG TPA: type II secretion system F family protein [Blastocatellia bacterium]|jgi:type IV pilus assembly protein PilC|nr:type II secretion system F family protein [Blastocatellia bacterium]